MSDRSQLSFDQDAVLERLDGDVDLLHELAQLFLDDLPQVVADLQDAVDRGDAAQMSWLAHSLKGSAGNFAAKPTVDSTIRLEECCKAGDLNSAVAEFRTLREKLGQLDVDLRAMLDEADDA